MKLAPANQQVQSYPARQQNAAATNQDQVGIRSELDELIGPEPPLPDSSILIPTLKGAAAGMAAGAAIGYATRAGYANADSIPQASYIHFGGLLAGTAASGVVLGRAIEPAFDRGTSAAVGAITGMTFAVVSSMLGVACGPVAAGAYGGVMGAVMGFTGGMLHSQQQQSQAHA